MPWTYEHDYLNRVHSLGNGDIMDFVCVKDEDVAKTPQPVLKMLRVATEALCVKGVAHADPIPCKQGKYVNIQIEELDAKDYHDLVVKALKAMANQLYGGYYEPLSERDKELADKICKLLDEISETN